MIFLFLHLPILLLSVHAATLSKKYDQGPITLGPKASLHWTLVNSTRRISLAITIKDTSVLSSSGPAWIALGISEEASGSMLGSDIASAEFGSGMLKNCTLRDRYVPFSAYPIGESTVDAPSVFPNQDTCQSDGSWNLVGCTRDLQSGAATLELERGLDAHDTQDRAINPGSQAVIYAYGGADFRYHGKLRGSRRVVLFNDDGTYPAKGSKPLPKDITFTHTVLATNYAVPSENVTTYACTHNVVPLPKSGKRFLVAADPIIKSSSGKNKAHHLIVYGCKDTPYARQFAKTKYCMNDGPSGHCSAILSGWAVGVGRFVMPDDVGLEIDAANNFLIMETHYDNPDRATNAIDVSGAKLYFADTRPILGGIMTLGDPTGSLFGRRVKHKFEYASTCPSNCTSVFKEDINIFGSLLHMHTTGEKIYTNRFDKSGKFIETINSIEYWSNDHQLNRQFSPPKKLAPGDTLSTTCIYDTRKRRSTKFGLETKDEMCIDFLFYYPLQKRFQSDGQIFTCSMVKAKDNSTGTICGTAVDKRSYSTQSNPSLNDTQDTPDKFGKVPSTCTLATTTKNRNFSCFPGSAIVQTRSGQLRMRDLRLGDEVLVNDGSFSPVYMFTHRVQSAIYLFVELSTSRHKIALTEGHYLYVNDNLAPARSVRIGDALRGEDGTTEIVLGIRRVAKEGLYNPQTVHGDIVVDGIAATSYTDAVLPTAAHALLAPMRAVLNCFGWMTTAFERDESVTIRAFSMMRSFMRG